MTPSPLVCFYIRQGRDTAASRWQEGPFLPKLNSVPDQRSAFPLLTLVWARLLCELAHTVHGCVLQPMQATARLKVTDTNTDNRTVSPTRSPAQFISYHKIRIPVHLPVYVCGGPPPPSSIKAQFSVPD